MDLISFPFRVGPQGAVATVADGPDAYGEELAVVALTVRGERPLEPDLGVADPVGEGFDAAGYLAAVEAAGIPADVRGVDVDDESEPGRRRITVDWE